MLGEARAHATLPASDLERARRFYEDVVGLVPAAVAPGGVFYATGGGTQVFVFRRRGVVFETYDFPGFDPSTSIASFPANRSAWFHDTEGNLIGIVQMLDQS
jgi:predicted enzyme related to lactoylglutathione lyase